MKLEYSLDEKEMLFANIQLNIYVLFKLALSFIVIVTLIGVLIGKALPLFIGGCVGTAIGAILNFIRILKLLNENKYKTGFRTADFDENGFNVEADNFSIKGKWSKNRKVHISQRYLFLDYTGLLPIVVKRNCFSSPNQELELLQMISPKSSKRS